MVKVKFGGNVANVNGAAGATVEQIRSRAAGLLQIPSGSLQVVLNDNVISDLSTIVPEGATLEFIKVSGEKGA